MDGDDVDSDSEQQDENELVDEKDVCSLSVMLLADCSSKVLKMESSDMMDRML